MDKFTERATRVVEPGADTTAETARAVRAIHALSEVDLVRLKALARVWTRGLPGGLGWTDVLNEAIARVLDGSRRWPPDVRLLAFLSGVMRSICDELWRCTRRDLALLVRREDYADAGAPGEQAESLPDPERVLVAGQALAAVYRLFATDPPALKIIAGLDRRQCVGSLLALISQFIQLYSSFRRVRTFCIAANGPLMRMKGRLQSWSDLFSLL